MQRRRTLLGFLTILLACYGLPLIATIAFFPMHGIAWWKAFTISLIPFIIYTGLDFHRSRQFLNLFTAMLFLGCLESIFLILFHFFPSYRMGLLTLALITPFGIWLSFPPGKGKLF